MCNLISPEMHVIRRWAGLRSRRFSILLVGCVMFLLHALPAFAQSNEEIAERLSISVDQVQQLTAQRAMSSRSLARFPADRAPRLILRLDYPDLQRERLAFRLIQNRDERGTIPHNGLYRAFQQLEQIKQVTPIRSTAGIPCGGVSAHRALPLTAGLENQSWVWLGPGNVGGRTRSLLIHPDNQQTMWAGSVGGGVWRTDDGGQTWTPLADFMGNLAIACMAMSPQNPDVIYAGTGEGFGNVDALRGAGIFRTMDGGLNWQQLPSTASDQFRRVNRLAISPNGATILAATGVGIYRSTDQGHSWTRQSTRVAGDLDFHPTDNTRAVAGALDGGAYYSTDGGATWIRATPNLLNGRVELTYAAANSDIVYASADIGGGRLLRSTDGGATYSTRNDTTNYLGEQGWYDNVVWAGDPTDAEFVLVGGVDLWRSTDGGATLTDISTWWSPQSAHADHHVILAHPQFDGNSNLTVYFGNDGGIYSTNNVRTVGNDPVEPRINGWIDLNNNYGVTQFYGAAGHEDTNVIIGGAQDNGTLRYSEAGGQQTWSEMFGGDGGYCASDPTDPNVYYGEYVYLNIHRSTDGGQTSEFISGKFWNSFVGAWQWKPEPFRIPDAFQRRANFIAAFVIDPGNANRILAGGRSLWRTNDARTPNTSSTGPSWERIKSPAGVAPISAIAIAASNSDIIWVGHNDGRVYRTPNGTTATPTWERLDNNPTPLPNRYCQRITINPSDTDEAYVTFGGYSLNNVWKTTDGGTTWQATGSTLPAAPVRSLVLHPHNADHVYIGTEVGVFASEDGGQSWSPTNEGPTNCSADELFWMGTDLVVATHGRGIFTIDLGGTRTNGDDGGVTAADIAELRALLQEAQDKLNDVAARLVHLEER